jgi:hypothetical protein
MWTGNSVLAYMTTTTITGSTHDHHPGETALWDPASRSWTSLPDAPPEVAPASAVWTGRELLVLGYDTAGRGAVSIPVVLRLGPERTRFCALTSAWRR